jgi:putative membrane-bound dehydrogenase-like protein
MTPSGWLFCIIVLLPGLALAGDDLTPAGRSAEKRFPPLSLPPGFHATLFACDPVIAYPSAIAAGPRDGSIFVAVDYLAGLGFEIVRRDEIRLIEDSDGDGYADKVSVYASGLNSIQGLAFHDGDLFVMHAPFLSVLRDADGDGKAEVRHDLLAGLGLPPEQNPWRLHCANGVTLGYDGWLYLALGDHGCDVTRPEGDRLVLHGGGILRCRPGGRELHVFATGLRNIYDIALDEDLDVFVRDNENDGGDYLVRVYHSFFGADHGYPYHYAEHPDQALRPLAILGRGSAAGGLCYREEGFPSEYRGNLFFCEWGRSVVRYRLKRQGSSFAPVEQIEFASGAPDDPYGFRPTDVIVQRDGSLIVADWADDQQPKRGRGRIYRITAAGQPQQPVAASSRPDHGLEGDLARLDSGSYAQRFEAQLRIERRGRETPAAVREAIRQNRLGTLGELHAVWILAHLGGSSAVDYLLKWTQSTPRARVKVQAIRAIADLSDPVLSQHGLAAGRGDPALANTLAGLAAGQDPQVTREVLIALARLGWQEAPAWVAKLFKIQPQRPDPSFEHAAILALRRSANWPALLALLDKPDSEPIRSLALRAVAECFDPELVDGLIERLETERSPDRRCQYADLLARVHKKPGSWVYWGFRPGPRPANTVAWERTGAISEALDRTLADRDRKVRLAVLLRMQREKITPRLATLNRWLDAEPPSEAVVAILESVRNHGPEESRDVVETIVAGCLKSPDPNVRALALEAAAALRLISAGVRVQALLADPAERVRQAAAIAAGALDLKQAALPLIELARDHHASVRRASLDALRKLRERRVIPLAVQMFADPDMRSSALLCIADLGGNREAAPMADLAKRSPTAEILPLVVRTMTRWSQQSAIPQDRIELDHAVAEIQGATGCLVRWELTGPVSSGDAESLVSRSSPPHRAFEPPGTGTTRWRTIYGTGADARVHNEGFPGGSKPDSAWVAFTDLAVSGPARVEVQCSSDVNLRAWVNGKRIDQNSGDRPPSAQPGFSRAAIDLIRGLNRVFIELACSERQTDWQLRFRQISSSIQHESLIKMTLDRPGDPERGRKVFDDVEKSLCLKCHRIGEKGERIGPDLSGIGARFSRVAIIESILEPSRSIAPGFDSVTMALKDGRVLNGLRVAESEGVVTLADQDGQKHTIPRAEIEAVRSQPVSLMPEGLERRLTPQEFVDLVAYLINQR